MVTRNGVSNLVQSVAVVYMPTPKKAACPRLKYPAKPLSNAQLVDSAIQKKTRYRKES
jgi:hypothetical protein